MNKKAKRDFLNTLSRALSDGGLYPDPRAAAEQLRERGCLDGLSAFFPLRGRVSCADVAKCCAPLLGEEPERGWCTFCYDFIRARNISGVLCFF